MIQARLALHILSSKLELESWSNNMMYSILHHSNVVD